MKKIIKIGVILAILFGLLWAVVPQTPDYAIKDFNLEEEVLPYFKGYDPISKDLIKIEGEPKAVTYWENTLVVEFTTENGSKIYVSPLALRSKPWGEHPADKLLRLREEYNLKTSRAVAALLETSLLRNDFFYRVDFEYAPGWKISGVVAEVGIDGSFLVIPSSIPREWRAKGSGGLAPSFFFVGFEPQNTSHQEIHKLSGYELDPNLLGSTLFEKMRTLRANHHSANRSANRWIVEQLRTMGLALEADINSIGGYRITDGNIYFSVSNGFSDSTKGIFYKLTPDDDLVEIFRAPGRLLMTAFNPLDPTKLLVSAEGYDKDDPRFQSIFEVDVETENWRVVEFPIPANFELYGGQTYFFARNGTFMVQRYGSIWEGGGVWTIDSSDLSYEPKKMLLPWDHFQQWVILPTEDPQVFIFVFTAKEVEDNFAMTINQAQILFKGKETQITQSQRVALLAGWNPQPIRIQKTEKGKYLLYVDSKFDYYSYLDGRPSAIYVVEISQ